MNKIKDLFSWVKKYFRFFVSALILLVALILSLFQFETTNIQNNFFIDNLLQLSITATITISIALNIAINIKFETNNYSMILKHKNPAFLKSDEKILEEIKETMEPLTYFFIDRSMSLPWPQNMFNNLFILENTLKIASYNFANPVMQNTKEELHQAIVNFTSAVVINEDLENGMHCSRYYYFSNKGRHIQVDLEKEKRDEDELNKYLSNMLVAYYKFLTIEKKILQENLQSSSE